jgi:hypothetical protein
MSILILSRIREQLLEVCAGTPLTQHLHKLMAEGLWLSADDFTDEIAGLHYIGEEYLKSSENGADYFALFDALCDHSEFWPLSVPDLIWPSFLPFVASYFAHRNERWRDIYVQFDCFVDWIATFDEKFFLKNKRVLSLTYELSIVYENWKTAHGNRYSKCDGIEILSTKVRTLGGT